MKSNEQHLAEAIGIRPEKMIILPKAEIELLTVTGKQAFQAMNKMKVELIEAVQEQLDNWQARIGIEPANKTVPLKTYFEERITEMHKTLSQLL